jgi:hypothetical protein
MRLPTTFSSDRLTIYLNDHLAGAAAGRGLAARTLAANPGTEFESPLFELHRAIAEDHSEAQAIRHRLGVPEDRAKAVAGRWAERLGRLKPNGQLTGYSPLSRLLELEGLASGIQAKLWLWRSLRDSHGEDPRLVGHDFDRLIARAESQLETIAEVHRQAARLAL